MRAGRRVSGCAGEEEEEVQEEEGEQEKAPKEKKPMIDIDNFADQPLPEGDTVKIKGLKGEWDSYISSFRNTVMGVSVNVAEAMAEVGMGKDGEAVSSMIFF